MAAEPSDKASHADGISSESPPAREDASPTESGNEAAQKPSTPKPEEKKQPKLKQLWDKTGLDALTLKQMFKGSLPPTIAIAMYQSTAVQTKYTTLGYLIAISSVLGFCILPQGKFVQTMILDIFTICLATAINILALFCAVKARINTTPPDILPDAVTYNASASAVCAIWFIVQVYIINSLRAARPQFLFPAILSTIFTAVSLTYGCLFLSVSQALDFMERLLETFLTGFGLATAVHFIVFPLTTRKVVFKEMTGYLMLLGGCLQAQTAYMTSLEKVDPAELREKYEKEAKEAAKSHHNKHKKQPTILETPVLTKLRETQDKLLELHGKLNGDITPAKREIVIGKLESHDLTLLWKQLREVFLPIMGLMSMINILERRAEMQGWAERGDTEEEEQQRLLQVESVHLLLKTLHEPFATMSATIGEAFKHILLTLELTKPPKTKQSDEESKGDEPAKPGTPGFAEVYKKKVEAFYESRQKTLRDWGREHGINMPPDYFETAFTGNEDFKRKGQEARERNQRQLFFILYLEYLLWRASASALDLIVFVDKKKADGVFTKSKLIFPGSKTLYKWAKATLGREDVNDEDSYTTEMDSGKSQAVYLGEYFGKQRDPEHLPPRTTAEKIGNAIRVIPNFFRSEASVFGLRVVAATMTVGIVCYLHDSQSFFLEQRLLWALIMIAISMMRTAGQTLFNLVIRIFGTFLAMVGSYIIWYIVDGHTPGVIVFLWLWIFLCFYVVFKMPKFIIVGVLTLVTAILIIGYELQVKAIGIALATSNGQPAYPTYELAPYRLATVVGGLFVAFIWSIFPYPISEASELRKDLSSSLYLLSHFYAAVHETVNIRVANIGGAEDTKGTHAYKLEKVRMKLFSKLIALVSNLKTNSAFSKFQLRLGGRFPREDYEKLISCVQRMMLWTSLASYSSNTFQKSGSTAAEMTEWSNDFRQLLSGVTVTSNKICSLLAILSSSLSSGQPLPPYLEIPEQFQFLKRLEAINRDILSIRHLAEPEYSAFAVVQIASQSMNMDMQVLVELIKKLVGEIDFSESSSVSAASSSNTLSKEDSEEDKGKVE